MSALQIMKKIFPKPNHGESPTLYRGKCPIITCIKHQPKTIIIDNSVSNSIWVIFSKKERKMRKKPSPTALFHKYVKNQISKDIIILEFFWYIAWRHDEGDTSPKITVYAIISAVCTLATQMCTKSSSECLTYLLIFLKGKNRTFSMVYIKVGLLQWLLSDFFNGRLYIFKIELFNC